MRLSKKDLGITQSAPTPPPPQALDTAKVLAAVEDLLEQKSLDIQENMAITMRSLTKKRAVRYSFDIQRDDNYLITNITVTPKY